MVKSHRSARGTFILRLKLILKKHYQNNLGGSVLTAGAANSSNYLAGFCISAAIKNNYLFSATARAAVCQRGFAEVCPKTQCATEQCVP
jgi:hypothetical protein